jgi:peptidoglycan/xylan/chitin deacetylase (PgdA/CDA1 family)
MFELLRPARWRKWVRSGMAAVLPRRLFLVRGTGKGGGVFLTFDDGPHPEHTPRLLDVLRDQGARATFFVIGKNAERYPDLVRRMAGEGHVVGHHTFFHNDPARTSPRQLSAEVGRTRDLLGEILGQRSNLFRPPHGQLSPAQLLTLWRAGQTVVLWNADTRDFACGSAAEFRAYFRERPLRGGDVVLMHDDRPHAAAGLPEVMAEARARGLRFAAISPCFS